MDTCRPLPDPRLDERVAFARMLRAQACTSKANRIFPQPKRQLHALCRGHAAEDCHLLRIRTVIFRHASFAGLVAKTGHARMVVGLPDLPLTDAARSQ